MLPAETTAAHAGRQAPGWPARAVHACIALPQSCLRCVACMCNCMHAHACCFYVAAQCTLAAHTLTLIRRPRSSRSRPATPCRASWSSCSAASCAEASLSWLPRLRTSACDRDSWRSRAERAAPSCRQGVGQHKHGSVACQSSWQGRNPKGCWHAQRWQRRCSSAQPGNTQCAHLL